MLHKYEETLDKVRTVLNDMDTVNEVIESIGSSKKEPIEIYKTNKETRIKAMLVKAEVTMEE